MYTNIVEVFCIIDDFSKMFDQTMRKHSLEEVNSKKKRNRKFRMSDSEVMTILVMFLPLALSRSKVFLSELYLPTVSSIFPTGSLLQSFRRVATKG